MLFYNVFAILCQPMIYPKLHIANTFFEWELETDSNLSLYEAFYQNPIYLQLQFLPLLYADASTSERVIVSDKPPESDLFTLNLETAVRNGKSTQDFESESVTTVTHSGSKNCVNSPSSTAVSRLKNLKIPASKLITLDGKSFPPGSEIESWGASQLIAKWAKTRGLIYHIPHWQLIKQINSKQFSFENAPQLPGSKLLRNEMQAKEWIDSCKGKKVLKTCFGLSGKGHLFIENSHPSWDLIASFLHRQWKMGLPVIAEPWMQRILDFSTQWKITKQQDVLYLGATLCHNDSRGQYRSTSIGEEKDLFNIHLPFLEQHRTVAEPLLEAIAKLGFFGNIGIDAMIYHHTEPTLHPIVEINARKTMGWVALAFQKRYFPDETIHFCFSSKNYGCLPSQLTLKNGKTLHFSRNLSIQLNPVHDKN